MKNLDEIPECSKILDKIIEEMHSLPQPKQRGYYDNWEEEKKILDKYWIKLDEAYKKYMAEHPEEFEEK